MTQIEQDDKLLRGKHRKNHAIQTLEVWAPAVGDAVQGELSARGGAWGAIDFGEVIRIRVRPLTDQPLCIQGRTLVHQLRKLKKLQLGDKLRFTRMRDKHGSPEVQISVERLAPAR